MGLVRSEDMGDDVMASSPRPICCSRRLSLSLFILVGFTALFGMRCNIGAAVVRMTNSVSGPPEEPHFTLYKHSHHNNKKKTSVIEKAQAAANLTRAHLDTMSEEEEAKVSWRPREIGLIESCFYWGYALMNVPAGYMTHFISPVKMVGTAVGMSGLLNLFFPTLVYQPIYTVFALRIVQGFIEGMAYPACHALLASWAPPGERSILATLAYTGTYSGVVVGMLFSNIISDLTDWTVMFYCFGCACVVWALVWLATMGDTPETDRWISEEERDYITKSLEEETPHQSGGGGTESSENSGNSTEFHVPWKAIMLSAPVHAIILANIARTWTFYLMVLNEPQYFKQMFRLEKYSADMLMAVPHVCMSITVPVAGFLADRLRSSCLSTTVVRKLFNGVGFGGAGFFLALLGGLRSPFWAIFVLSLVFTMSGVGISGYNVNHLDIAPKLAAILLGISNGLSTLTVLVVPIMTEQLVVTYGIKHGWQYTFLVAGAVHAVAVIHYSIFASGEKQRWAEGSSAGASRAKLNADDDGAESDSELRPVTSRNTKDSGYKSIGGGANDQ